MRIRLDERGERKVLRDFDGYDKTKCNAALQIETGFNRKTTEIDLIVI